MPIGFCHCGCRGLAGIVKVTDNTKGRIRGNPSVYRVGHHGRITPQIEDAVPFKIDGIYCRLIALTKGMHAIVDASDYEWLMEWKWHANWSPTTRSYYATGYAKGSAGKKMYMHKEIIARAGVVNEKGDHENHVTLDNRRDNLRAATNTESARNRRSQRRNRYKGVHFRESLKKWAAVIRINGKLKHLGFFESPAEASRAYAGAARDNFGEFACVE